MTTDYLTRKTSFIQPFKKEIINEFYNIERQSDLLKRMRKIENTLLSSGAYSETNMERQNKKFESINAPEWEKDIINNGYMIKRKLSHKLMRQYEKLIKLIESELIKDGD